MLKRALIFACFIQSSFQYMAKFFNHWHCVGIKDAVDLSKPIKFNVGELPLVMWKNKENELITCLNICKHMGSKLDNGIITNEGCLKCRYHGLEFTKEDRFGETMEHEGKIFWSYNPSQPAPYKIPFFNNKHYEKSFLQIDMEASLPDSRVFWQTKFFPS
jgi:nitrite reductase/ring-hydroxylating ferredoxin subunit